MSTMNLGFTLRLAGILLCCSWLVSFAPRVRLRKPSFSREASHLLSNLKAIDGRDEPCSVCAGARAGAKADLSTARHYEVVTLRSR